MGSLPGYLHWSDNAASVSFGNGAYGINRRQGPGTVGVSPILSFDTIGNLTTCEPATIRWFYAGAPINMTLSVTNIGVTQISSPPSPFDQLDLNLHPSPHRKPAAPTKVNPASLTFEWPSVNVTSGSYQFEALIISQNYLKISDVFYVLQGPNTACLPASSTSTIPSSVPTGGSPSIPAPVSGASSKPINTSAIVGIVLGVLALIMVVLAVWFFLRHRKQQRQIGAGKKGSSKKWNALNSTDSRAGIMAAVGANNDKDPRERMRRHSQSQRRNYSQSSSLGPTEETVTGDLSEEKLGASYSSRKNSIASYDSMALAALPSLPHSSEHEAGGRRSKGSYLDIVGANVARRRSTDAKTRSQLYLPPIESSHSTVSRTSSFGGVSEATHPIPPPDPHTPQSDAKRANRQSFGRKRKPVPAYDGEAPASPIPASPIPPSPMPSEAHLTSSEMGYHGSPSQPPQLQLRHPQPQNPSTVGHYSTRGAAISRPNTTDSSELLHKTSFGVEGKPVHYLMPDLPPDSQTQSRR
ncbi:hypothetical protein DFP72DRAFT_1167984 [Ephemerocybe angulata]|uniref:Uncharacterized protein n=1 Tax=Ephemerocybe angulata TaxID=980116 RepID=A0A8H6I472_9AGAR|nr:hypothetical protein DFP72DRAFT_1167984 [Tulosesus angulatus]